VEGGATRGTTALVYGQLHISIYTDTVQGYWSTPVWFDRQPEAAVLDVLWGGNRELTGRNQEVWPHAPYVMQS
jgi:hypothetical protein